MCFQNENENVNAKKRSENENENETINAKSNETHNIGKLLCVSNLRNL